MTSAKTLSFDVLVTAQNMGFTIRQLNGGMVRDVLHPAQLFQSATNYN
jgi:hypothetical protein